MTEAAPPEQGPQTGTGRREVAQVSVGDRDGVAVVMLAGELDISNIDLVGEVIFTRPNTGDGLIVNLSGVGYLDSTAVSLLHDLAARLRSRAQQLIVVSPAGSAPRRVLELTALDVNAPIADELEAAISLLRGTARP